MDEIADIKQRLDITEVISGYLTLKKAGVNYKGLCPFHNEKTPSFMVSAERQTFKCFGCGEGGDIISFMEKIEGLDFYNALKLLADRAGVKLKSQSVKFGDQEYRADRKTRLFEINDWTKKVYHKLLLDHPKAEKARQYLQKRGLSEATIEDFSLGFAPDSWDFITRFLKSKKFTDEEIFQAGITVRNDRGGYYDRFRGRVMFPIANIMGSTIGFTSRTLKEDVKEAKYINSADSPIYTKGEVIYSLDKAKSAIREADLAIVVEGQMDVIACHQAGYKNVIASSGTALTIQQLKILSRYSSEVALCFDSDSAGETAMKRAVTLALQNDITAKVIAMPPPYKDPDEAIKADPKNWVRAIKEAKPALEHWIDLLVRHSPDLSVIAKKKIAKEILPVIKSTYSDVEKEGYLRYLSNKLSVSERSLWDALKKAKGAESSRESVSAPTTKIEKLSVPERMLVLVWSQPELSQKIASVLSASKFNPGHFAKFNKLIQSVGWQKTDADPVERTQLDAAALQLGEEMDLSKCDLISSELDFLVAHWQLEQREEIRESYAEKIRLAEEAGRTDEVKRLVADFARLIK